MRQARLRCLEVVSRVGIKNKNRLVFGAVFIIISLYQTYVFWQEAQLCHDLCPYFVGLKCHEFAKNQLCHAYP